MTTNPPHAGDSSRDPLAVAAAHYQAGRLQEAEHAAFVVLGGDPRNVRALTLLGAIALATGRAPNAEQMLSNAVRVDPRNFAAQYYRGEALRALGRFREALSCFDMSLAVSAGVIEAHVSRAIVLSKLVLPLEALKSLDHALALQPSNAAALNTRAAILLELGRFDEALEAADRAIKADPSKASAHSNRAASLHRLGRYAEALQSADRALECAPADVFARLNRAAVLRNMGRREESLGDYDAVIERAAGSIEAHVNRATLLQEMGRPAESLQSCERVLELDASRPDILYTRGVVLHELGRHEDALESHRRAAALSPVKDEARDLARAFIHLQRGNLSQGWELFEHREKPGPGSGRGDWPIPLWHGDESLSGKTLFIYWEQGLGDSLQFSRYVRLAAERGARVSFSVQNALHALLQSLHPNVKLLKQDHLPLDAELRCPILSLPRAFRTTIETIPAPVPYLRADPVRVAAWDKAIGRGGLRVGICWQGNPGGRVDIGRSFPLRLFENLATFRDLRLISLQKGPGIEQLESLPRGMNIESPGEGFDSGTQAFLDAAAVIEILDLVVTSDTAVAHLAGALGKPTWLLLQKIPDWRWFLDRTDSPWYPTMRLFRQPTRGDWPAVFAAVEREMRSLLGARSAGSSSSATKPKCHRSDG